MTLRARKDAEMKRLQGKELAIPKLAAEVLTVRKAKCCIVYSDLIRQTPSKSTSASGLAESCCIHYSRPIRKTILAVTYLPVW